MRWGEGTTDEMCIAFLRVTVDAERLSGPLSWGAPTWLQTPQRSDRPGEAVTVLDHAIR